MIMDKVSVHSNFILSLESGDTKQEKGGTQKFLTVDVHSTTRNGSEGLNCWSILDNEYYESTLPGDDGLYEKCLKPTTHKRSVSTMSLLGPDDFDLGKKGRKKKLAKDLSPSVAKEIERWLDRENDPEAFRRVSELVGPEEAARLFARRRRHGRKLEPGDPLLEE